MSRHGKLVVLSGSSGSGKSTVIAALLSRHPDIAFSVSATTREIRPSEKNGVNYFFVSKQSFEKMIENKELLEYAMYVDNYYGTPRKAIEENQEKGRDILLDIEVRGALQVKAAKPDAVLVFLKPPSMEELERRLRSRGDVAEGIIAKRLETAVWEQEQSAKYDYIVVNDSVENAVSGLEAILRTDC